MQAVVGGEALEEALIALQNEWENTPHPAHAGQTPADVVRAWTSSEVYPGTNPEPMADGAPRALDAVSGE